MKKYLIPLILFTFIAICYAAVISVSKFGGLNTDTNPLFIEGTPDSENVITDDGPGLKPREGVILFSTEPSNNLYSFYTSAGYKYFITQSSNVLKATLGGYIFDIRIGTVTPNAYTSISALGDKLYYSNSVDGLKVWDLSTVQVVTGTYKARYIVTHKGRLWLAGVVGDERTIYVSEYLDGSNFTLVATDSAVDTDPTRIQVQGALDDILTGFYSSFQDKIVWFKQRSFGMISGTRRLGFQSREYSNTVGCSYPDSIQNCDGVLRWLGNDRVVYEFDGSSYYPINKDIDNLMDTVVQGDLNNRNWTQTTASDWNSGTIGVGLDTTTISGSIGFVSQVATTSVSTFLSTSSNWRSGGTSDSIFVNYSTAMTGALATMFIPTCSLQLDKVNMSFYYKSNVVEGFQSWVTLHQGATCPNAVVVDTSTRHDYTTNTSGVLTQVATSYFFTQSTSTDKRLTQGVTYWFVLHTTITSPNTNVIQQVFNYTGSEQTFIIPLGVSSITVDIAGAEGLGTTAGKGGKVFSSMTVIPNSIVYVYIGEQGNGSHHSFGGGGGLSNGNRAGGSSDIRIGGTDLSNRVLVAGGGGGAGQLGFNGGDGGYPSGGNGNTDGAEGGGGGGTQLAGGAGGVGTKSGTAGAIFQGGDNVFTYAGGGGGGGYYGGGGGASSNDTSHAGGGGGGSSYSSFGGVTFVTGANGSGISFAPKAGISTFTYISHAEFYSREINTPNLSSTTLLYTSSFTIAGSNYSIGLYDTGFEVFFATAVFQSTWTSKTFDSGSKSKEWSTFEITETKNGGSSEYSIYSGTNSTIDVYDSSTYQESQTVTDGNTPTIGIYRYIKIKSKYSRDLSTHQVYTSDLIVNFNEGSSLRTFGQYISQRYWIGVAISSTSNNKVLVYDRNKQWQRYSGINISAIVNYSGTFYFGNNNGIFQAEYGTDDNGSPITAYYKTKTFPISGTDIFSTFKDLWMTTENNDVTLQTQYYIDELATAYSLPSFALNTQLGYQNFRLPFNDSSLKQGKYISFKWTVSSINPWRILNANLYYDSDTEPSEQLR